MAKKARETSEPKPIDLSHDKLLDSAAAAEALGISKYTINNWRARGTGPRYVRLGDRVLYPMKSLNEFVNSHVVDVSQK